MSSTRPIEFADLMKMDRHQLHAIMDRAYPLDLDALADTQYQGVDLSLPPFINKLLWKTFRKTFHRDPASGSLRGWNYRMEQRGIDGPQAPLQRHGKPWAFAHYEVRSAAGLRFPRRWHGGHYLDYGHVGNPFGEALAYAPLVAVNEGRMDLLLGWEVFKLGPLFIPLPDYWVLRLEGPLEEILPMPKSVR